MKNIFTIFLVSCLTTGAFSQTLFTYGSHRVDAKDFLRAYNKNNSQPTKNKAKSISDYLDLYIKSRLKIQEAYERHYDTLLNVKQEVANLRAQIADNYMADPNMITRMKKEAFQRSQKDIHVAHIFISFKNLEGIDDTAAAAKKREDILGYLKKGEDFFEQARQNSDDPSARANGGDLGFITVFTLPYEFESAIYASSPGKPIAVVASKQGYHIFKNLGERKAVGRIKAQQILLALPPGADDAEKKRIADRADSLYKRIMAGDNFNKLANQFSNDYISAASGGVMPEIGVGQYNPDFEKVLWSLAKDSAVSKPFLTSHGWHILKRLSLKAVVTDPNNKTYQQELEQRIMADNRWRLSKDFVYNKVISQAGYKKFDYNDAALWNMTDSILDYKPMTTGRSITATTPLFSIGSVIFTANDWINYANTNRFKQDGTGAKPLPQVRQEWVQSAMTGYYRDHLEDFSEDFRNQMTEFREGNLFFEIMQQEIWNKSQNDSAALLSLYEKNKKKYTWKQSADAVLFFCSDITTANSLYASLKADAAGWKKKTDAYSEKVVADSSRYEWEQVPGLGKAIPQPGMLTSPQANSTDNTASFAYIIHVYPNPSQRNYEEARGLVINDYQLVLEEQWNEALKKKYPVVVDQKVLQGISK